MSLCNFPIAISIFVVRIDSIIFWILRLFLFFFQLFGLGKTFILPKDSCCVKFKAVSEE